MKNILQAVVLLSSSWAGMAMAEQKHLEPCSLADRKSLAANISCGSPRLVTRCLIDLAEDESPLQACLIGAGCTVQEGSEEAEQAVSRCGTSSDIDESKIELRNKQARNRLRTIQEVVEVRRAHAAADDENTGTTLAKVAIRDEATPAPTSTNTWVMIQHLTGTRYTTVTCMTPATVATSSCSFINDAEETTCAPTTVVVPSCVPGMTCGFSKTSGSVRCAQKGGFGTGGFVVAGVLGVAAAITISALCFSCCRERRVHKRDRRAAEAQAALAAEAEAKRSSSRAASGMAAGDDYVPLMDASGGRQGPQQPRQADPFRGGQQYHDSR